MGTRGERIPLWTFSLSKHLLLLIPAGLAVVQVLPTPERATILTQPRPRQPPVPIAAWLRKNPGVGIIARDTGPAPVQTARARARPMPSKSQTAGICCAIWARRCRPSATSDRLTPAMAHLRANGVAPATTAAIPPATCAGCAPCSRTSRAASRTCSAARWVWRPAPATPWTWTRRSARPILDDAQRLASVPLDRCDLVLADPPYSVEGCGHYGTSTVKRNRVVRALAGLQKARTWFGSIRSCPCTGSTYSASRP